METPNKIETLEQLQALPGNSLILGSGRFPSGATAETFTNTFLMKVPKHMTRWRGQWWWCIVHRTPWDKMLIPEKFINLPATLISEGEKTWK